MTLNDYLLKNFISKKEFARQYGFNYENIRLYCNGTRIPRIPFLKKIYEVTAGQVTPADFYDLPKPLNDNSDTGPDAA